MIQHPECCCKRRPFQLFDKTIKEGIEPDYASFVGVPFACSHAGFVD
jgi:hypothetical protein